MKNIQFGDVKLPPYEPLPYTPPPKCKPAIQFEEERVVGVFEKGFGNFGRALDELVPVFKRAIESLTYKEEDLQDYQMRRWLSQVPHGGIVGEKAVLIMYNEQHPSQSILIVEDINI